MAISRLLVSSSHRRLGIAHSLLGAAAATFIHGYPKKGQVAFSQPARLGQAVMKHWGCTKVYEE
jgi:N-acetyltransferase